MKHLSIIYVWLLMGVSVFAQTSNKSGFAEPIKKDGPQIFTEKEAVRADKARTLVSPEEANTALFNQLEIRQAYNEILTLNSFYAVHGAEDLWKTTLKAIFDDRQAPLGREKCAAIAKLYPEYIEPVAPKKFNHNYAIKEKLGEKVQDEFVFCLAYLGLEYLDKEIWDVYISQETELIKEISELTAVSNRMKGFIMAIDFRTKVCHIENGLSKAIK